MWIPYSNNKIEFFILGKIDNTIDEKAAIGFIVKVDNIYEKAYTERLYFRFHSNEDCELHSLDYVNKLINQIKTDVKIVVHFSSMNSIILFFREKMTFLHTENIVNDFKFTINSITRSGKDITLDYTQQKNRRLVELVDDALENHKLIDEIFFKYILSIGAYTSLDYLVLEELENQDAFKKICFVECIDEFTMNPGIAGVQKRIISASDQISMNNIITSFNSLIINLEERFPYKKSFLTSQVRRIGMIIRDTDLFFLFTPFEDSNNLSTFLFPDWLFILFANYFNKKIYIFNDEDKNWYKRTEAKKFRNLLVQSRAIDINQIQSISYYSHIQWADNFQRKFIPVLNRFLKD